MVSRHHHLLAIIQTYLIDITPHTGTTSMASALSANSILAQIKRIYPKCGVRIRGTDIRQLSQCPFGTVKKRNFRIAVQAERPRIRNLLVFLHMLDSSPPTRRGDGLPLETIEDLLRNASSEVVDDRRRDALGIVVKIPIASHHNPYTDGFFIQAVKANRDEPTVVS